MSETKHTPTPWLYDGTNLVYALDETGRVNRFSASVQTGWKVGGYRGCGSNERADDAEMKANAAFIVEAVNSHAYLTQRVSELEAENARLRASVVTFADVADFMDSETEGFTVTDTLVLVIASEIDGATFEVKDFQLGDFYEARAALKGGSNG